PAVEKARSAFVHEGEAAALVLRFKKGSKYLFRTLCDFLMPLLEREFADADSLTFVPMTKRARRKRGYNQSRLLAEELSRRSGKQFLDAAEKRRETSMQKSLGRREREKNLKGCFRVTDKGAVRGKRIVIVDDTFTTGSTVSELARALLHAGAECVYALTVTSVPDRRNAAENRT
ncbi:MAG TPA: ComF family protein, partial [Firmicutes bacterium]|nr:ComF family protein [Bacillota bacterium]